MKQLLPPVPYSTPVLGSDGLVSQGWRGFFTKLSEGSINILGTNQSDLADTGYVGEFIYKNSSGPSIGSSGAYTALASIQLTAGDWDVEGIISVQLATITSIYVLGAISTSSSAPDLTNSGGICAIATGPYFMRVPTGSRRISLSTTQDIYLVGALFYSLGSGSWSAESFIRARRIR